MIEQIEGEGELVSHDYGRQCKAGWSRTWRYKKTKLTSLPVVASVHYPFPVVDCSILGLMDCKCHVLLAYCEPSQRMHPTRHQPRLECQWWSGPQWLQYQSLTVLGFPARSVEHRLRKKRLVSVRKHVCRTVMRWQLDIYRQMTQWGGVRMKKYQRSTTSLLFLSFLLAHFSMK